MFLIEWTKPAAGGQTDTSQEPSSKVMVSHSIGGWNYGNFALQLNKQKTTWMIDLKTTITSDPDPVWHEGSTHFAVDRGTWEMNTALSQGWSCGTGHVQGNQLTYNTALDKWGRYCWTDGCYKEGKPAGISGACYGAFFGTVPKLDKKGPAQILFLPGGNTWNWNGGPMVRAVSRGAKGFLGVAVQPDQSGERLTVGIIALPPDQSECRDTTNTATAAPAAAAPCVFKWLPTSSLGGGTNTFPRAGKPEKGAVGFANVQHIGPGGEGGDRFMVGWADDVQFQGKAKQYYVAEVDAEGTMYGEVEKLDKTGWGEEDAWAALEQSGCIAFPSGWDGDAGPGQEYGKANTMDKMSDIMHVTVVCPDALRQAASGQAAAAAAAGDPGGAAAATIVVLLLLIGGTLLIVGIMRRKQRGPFAPGGLQVGNVHLKWGGTTWSSAGPRIKSVPPKHAKPKSVGKANGKIALPAGWAKAVDESSGNTYYWHEATGATQWEPPVAP